MRNSFLMVMTIVMLTACSNFLNDYIYDVRGRFDESSTHYNNMIRWNELDKASIFLTDSQRENSLSRLKAASAVRVVDSRVVGIMYNKERLKATVEVEIDYYLLTSTKVKTLRDVQEWAYIEERGATGWRVMTPLPDLK